MDKTILGTKFFTISNLGGIEKRWSDTLLTGLTQVAQVARLSAEQLAAHGVRKDIARRIVNHLKTMAM